ncbi:unnamed protein product [Prorocentrum cordatum]|uniref:Uncharacterized protein n=1 Tax=Prorocentrum cordatum TaxID=2364126 RepID=A0ABN9TTS3_9DINO|nr:unnamed protein product [Polarella glacialis]
MRGRRLWADGVKSQGTPLMKCRSVCTHAKHCLTETDAAEAVRILLNPPQLSDEESQEGGRGVRRAGHGHGAGEGQGGRAAADGVSGPAASVRTKIGSLETGVNIWRLS